MMKSVFWWRKPEYLEETTDLRQVAILLEDRRRAHLLNYMYKGKNNINYLANQGRNTRLFEGAVLNTVVAKRKAAERSIYIKGAAAWNALPASIRNLPSYQIFKYHQKSWLRETLR